MPEQQRSGIISQLATLFDNSWQCTQRKHPVPAYSSRFTPFVSPHSLPLLRTPASSLRLTPRRGRSPGRLRLTRWSTTGARSLRDPCRPRHPSTHNLATHKTDTQHHNPPGHTAQRPHEVSERLEEAKLRKHAVHGVQAASVLLMV